MRKQHREAQQAQSAAARPDRGVETILPDAGNIAVVDESEGVSIPSGFDLDGKSVEFRPSGANASAYTFAAVGSRFDTAAISGATALQLADDDAKEAALQFSFPFYGVRYSSVWVHSDGYLSFGPAFGEQEDPSLPRDFLRMVIYTARAAPLMVDLDPSQPDAAVSFVSTPARFLVTWRNAPLYSERPGPTVARQTFQAALFPDGHIEFSYSGVNIASEDVADVGIAPGGAVRFSDITFVRLSSDPSSPVTTAIVQEFSNTAQFDVTAVPPKFFRNHEDSYDFVIVFDNVERPDVNACAFSLPIRNWVHGIGLRVTQLGIEEFDAGRFYGSSSRLQNLIYMGPLNRYPADPNQALGQGSICGRNSILTILGQEAGHRFLAYPLFIDPATGRPSTELLGRDFQHWSYYFNSDASLVEGNQIEDKGTGVLPRFETKQIVQRYSALDQYMMGLRAPEDVPPSFFVRQPSIDFLRGHAPQSGVLFDGTRVDVSLPMIVAAEGKRAPNQTLSPKQFRFAFVLLVPEGKTAVQADIDKVDRIRTTWESFFAAATENRARADTRIVKQVQLSVWPAAGLIQGRTITAAITLGAAAGAPVTVNLSASGGAVTVPGSVVIPAGSQSAEFPITANSAGTVELTAQGPDGFDAVRANLLVRPSAAGLAVERLSGALLAGALIALGSDLPFSGGAGSTLNQELIFRVRDENFLPYPGLALSASATGSGAVAPASPVTDSRGRSRLTWTLDSNPGPNTLTVTVQGQGDAARVQAIGVFQPARHRDPRIAPNPGP